MLEVFTETKLKLPKVNNLEEVGPDYLDVLWPRFSNYLQNHQVETCDLPQVEQKLGVPANIIGILIYLELELEEPYYEFINFLDGRIYFDLQGKIDDFKNCRTLLEQGRNLQEVFFQRNQANKYNYCLNFFSRLDGNRPWYKKKDI